MNYERMLLTIKYQIHHTRSMLMWLESQLAIQVVHHSFHLHEVYTGLEIQNNLEYDALFLNYF